MSRANPRFRRDQLPLPVPPVGAALLRFLVQGSIQGQTTLSSFCYRGQLAWLATFAEVDFSTAWETALKARYLDMLSDDFFITNYIVQWALPASRASVVLPPAGVVAGTVVSSSLDTMLASVFLRSTGLKTACGRGRVELPAIPISFITGGSSFLNTAGRAQAALTQNILGASLTVDGNVWAPCLISHGTRLHPGVLGTSDIVDVGFNPKVGTIRRRKVGRGV
jgi:hypothetical protein